MTRQPRPNALLATWKLAPCVTSIIAFNIVVFSLFGLARSQSELERFMLANFLVSSEHLVHGYVWTLVTSGFAHIELWHGAINMFVLWSFGLVLEQLWGSRTFLVFYLVGAVAGSAAHCLASSLLLGDGSIPALGASGATSAMLMAFGLHFPRHRILLFGLIPVPALAGVAAFAGLDLWGLVAQSRGGGLSIGHGAHLGGTFAGAVLWLSFLRRRVRPRAGA